MEKLLEWVAPEHEAYERGPDWYWVVGAVLLLMLISAAYLHNFLLIIITLVGGTLLFHFARRPPEEVACSLTDRGIIIHNELFPYKNISSFWIFDEHDHRKMVIETKRYVLPHLFIPIGDTPAEEIRQALQPYIIEKEYELTALDHITAYLGF